MRDVLAARPEPEVRERIERLLKELEPASENRLREQRAIEVLERIGTTEAQDALRGLAQGARRALLTQVAKASLGRLERTKLK